MLKNLNLPPVTLEDLSPGEIASACIKMVGQDPRTSIETQRDIVPQIYSLLQEAIEKYRNSSLSDQKRLLADQLRLLCVLVEKLKQSKYGKDFERHPFFNEVAKTSRAQVAPLIKSSNIIAPAG